VPPADWRRDLAGGINRQAELALLRRDYREQFPRLSNDQKSLMPYRARGPGRRLQDGTATVL
jgi:hypothetical protein